MPIYVYECPNGHISEHLFSVAEKPSRVACACHEIASQIVTPVGMVIASGWLGVDSKEEAALHRVREVNEWTEALGKRVDRHGSRNFNTAPTEPRSFEVARKKEHLKSGGQLPANFAHLADMG